MTSIQEMRGIGNALSEYKLDFVPERSLGGKTGSMAGEDEGRGFDEGDKRERGCWRLDTGSVATVIDLWLCGENESGEASERASEPSLGWERATETRNRQGEKGKGTNVRREVKSSETGRKRNKKK